MRKRNLLIAFGILTAFTVCYAARVNTFTGVGEGTAWEQYTAQMQTSGFKPSVYHIQKSLTAAQINGMYAAPVVLVPAPGAGKALAIVKVEFTIVRSSTAFASGGAAIIQYDSTVNGAGTQACDSTLASTVITGAAGTSISLRNGAIISDSTATIVNKGLYISNASGAFTTGTGTATVDVYYTVNPTVAIP